LLSGPNFNNRVRKEESNLVVEELKTLLTAYVYDPELKDEANRREENYWYEYIKEIIDQLGLRAEEVSGRCLDDHHLRNLDVLILGDPTAGELRDAAKSLETWVQGGGALIGFAVEGLDHIFGNTYFATTYQVDDYTLSGYFDLKPSPLTEEIHSPLAPDQKLLIYSDIRNVKTKSSTELGHLYGIQGVDHGFSAITERRYGLGYAYYFAFNVPKTVWVLHQGRPVEKDLDGDGRCTTRDLSVIGSNSTKVLYADELLYLLQNMIGRKRQPLIHQIPPKGGVIPKALFYWGGDDEGINTQVEASNWMKTLGLPYHVNILYPNFNLTPEQAKEILRNGHEISLHYNFVDEKFKVIPEKFTRESVHIQASAFKEKYGLIPVCTVNHGSPWLNGEELALWLMEVGGCADNTFVPPHYGEPSPNFGFGTSYPFHFYCGFKGRNAKIGFIEEPISCYEAGYDSERVYPETLSTIVKMAAKYHLLINLFYHSYRIAGWPTCKQAIKEFLKCITKENVKVVHMANNEVCRWWAMRSKAELNDVKVEQSQVNFKASCDYEAGMIIKVPIGKLEAEQVICDGLEAAYENRHEFGQNWVYLISPQGNHEITVTLSASS